MPGIIHEALVIFSYIVVVVISILYLSLGIQLGCAATSLKMITAPNREDDNHRQVIPMNWDDLTKDEQEIAIKRLPVAIIGYICCWAAYLLGIWLGAKIFIPGIIAFFSNIGPR